MEKKKRAGFVKTLQSGNEKAVLEVISKLRDEGDNEILYDLVQLYQDTENVEVKTKLTHFFCDLKNQESAPYMVDIIEDPKYKAARQMLVSACWQSRLDFADYLEVFIKLAIESPFALAFEAFTVIENTETKFTKERKEKLIGFTKQNSNKSLEDNYPLVHDIPAIINNFEEL